MSAVSKAKINKALELTGIPLEIERGKGYQYFIFDDGKAYETHSVYVAYLSHLTLEQWVAEAREAWRTMKSKLEEVQC